MTNKIEINGHFYQVQHIAPQVAMGFGDSNNPSVRSVHLERLIENDLWKPNSAEHNLIALPTDAQHASQSGVTRHNSTSHLGYTQWYVKQVDALNGKSASDQDLARKLVGLNNFLNGDCPFASLARW